jgi:ribonuclease P protein component
MLKKTYRLSSVRLKGPKLLKSESFDLKYGVNNLEFPRFGFVIPKKLDKRAVVRNSIKRKLSKIIEEIFDRIKGGRDFVFYPKSEILKIELGVLKSELEKALKKEGIIND